MHGSDLVANLDSGGESCCTQTMSMAKTPATHDTDCALWPCESLALREHDCSTLTWVMHLQGLPRNMKRCLAGMKEVAWAVNEPGRAKLVLIAPNIQIPCPDSVLLDQVLELVAKCRKADVPVIMGPSRKQLGMAFRTSGAVLLPHSVCLRLAPIVFPGPQVSPMHSNMPLDS